jgi:hypothetical protein
VTTRWTRGLDRGDSAFVSPRPLALAAASVAIASTLFAADALADFGPKFNDDWFFPVGVNAAAAFGNSSRSAGFVGGLEASLVHIDKDLDWVGAYGDVSFDTGIHRTRLTIGPEIGAACFGVDGGFAMLLGGDKPYPGFALRPMITLSLVTLYGRFVDFPGEPTNTAWGELGVLIKIPIPISETPARPPNPDLQPPPAAPHGPPPPPPPPSPSP